MNRYIKTALLMSLFSMAKSRYRRPERPFLSVEILVNQGHLCHIKGGRFHECARTKKRTDKKSVS